MTPRKTEGAPPAKVSAPPCSDQFFKQHTTHDGTASQERNGIHAILALPLCIGARWAQCPTCRHVFTTPANFDRHRMNGGCLYPFKAGLIINKRGMWCQPEGHQFTYAATVEGEITADTGSGEGQDHEA